MNSYERVLRRLKGDSVDKIPNLNIVMTFAAKYIGAPYKKYITDYRYLVKGNITCCEKFGIDMVSAISDPCRELHGFGADVIFPEDDVPKYTDFLLKDYSDIKNFSVVNPLKSERMRDRIKAIELYRKDLSGDYPILGWIEGALAEAVLLRGMTSLMIDLIEAPEFVHELLEICTEQAITFGLEQVKAGADFVGIGDSAASLIGPKHYQIFALPYEEKICTAIHKAGAWVKLHICGDITPILDLVPFSGADIIDVDWMVDFSRAVSTFSRRCSACGNFDPVNVMLRGTPEGVRQAVRECVAVASYNTFIAAGCEVPRETPIENMVAVDETLRELAL